MSPLHPSPSANKDRNNRLPPSPLQLLPSFLIGFVEVNLKIQNFAQHLKGVVPGRHSPGRAWSGSRHSAAHSTQCHTAEPEHSNRYFTAKEKIKAIVWNTSIFLPDLSFFTKAHFYFYFICLNRHFLLHSSGQSKKALTSICLIRSPLLLGPDTTSPLPSLLFGT
jgi:hypothetical protein